MAFETRNLILSTVLSITFMQCCKIVLMFYNVPTLGEEADLETHTFSLAQTPIGSTNV